MVAVALPRAELDVHSSTIGNYIPENAVVHAGSEFEPMAAANVLNVGQA